MVISDGSNDGAWQRREYRLHVSTEWSVTMEVMTVYGREKDKQCMCLLSGLQDGSDKNFQQRVGKRKCVYAEWLFRMGVMIVSDRQKE